MRPRMRLPSAASRSGAWRSSTLPGFGLAAVAIGGCLHHVVDRPGHDGGRGRFGFGWHVLQLTDLGAGEPAMDRVQRLPVERGAPGAVGPEQSVDAELD